MKKEKEGVKWFERSYGMQNHLLNFLALKHFGCERKKSFHMGGLSERAGSEIAFVNARKHFSSWLKL